MATSEGSHNILKAQPTWHTGKLRAADTPELKIPPFPRVQQGPAICSFLPTSLYPARDRLVPAPG